MVVLTSSSEEQDILRCYELQAGSYVTKPVDPDEFSRIVDAVANYWSAIATLPSAPNKYTPS